MGKTKKKKSAPQYVTVPQNQTANSILMAIFLAILVIVPIINRGIFISHVGPNITGSILDTGMKFEFASYYKMVILAFLTIAALAVFIYKLLKENSQISLDYTSIPLLALIILILLSGFAAKYQTLSLVGEFDRHEGTLTNLSYLFLFLVAANMVYTVRQTKWFYYFLYPVVGVNLLLVLLHFYNYDTLRNPFVLSLLLPPQLSAGGLSANSYINSTFGNPDFLSGFGGIVTILFLTRAILVTEMRERIINVVVAILCFAMVPTSFATSGFFTIVVMLPVVIVLLLFSKQRRQGALTGLVWLAACALLLFMFAQQNHTAWSKSMGFFIRTTPAASSQTSAGSSSQASSTSSNYNPFNLPPKGMAAGTGRVYIWKKTLQLVEKKPILGYGLDNLPYYFPQDDPAKNTGLGDPDIIVDKPHNNYLDYAFGSGIFALLAYLALLGGHFWQNIKLLRKGIFNERRITLASLFAAWCAYLVQAVFNDSTIGVSTVFWLLFGLSVALLRQETKSEDVSQNI